MKKILSLFLAFIMAVTVLNGVTVSAATVTASGTCGENLTWELDSDGVLTISGEGEMGNNSCNYRNSVKSLIIKDGVTSISDDAFFHFESLSFVEIADSVRSIGNNAFSHCKSLNNITISDSVVSIGDYAFNGCTSLTDVTIGNGVASIGDYAFLSCYSLETITVSGNNTKYYSEGNCLIETATNTLVAGCKTSIIPNSVIYIGDRAFENCIFLSSIELPESVTNIGESAFRDCSALASIEIPVSVTRIGDYAFSGCDSLEKITVSSGNSKYHSNGNCIIKTATNAIVAGCKTSVIPNYITKIESPAFFNCTSLTSIEIPESVTNIGESAFRGCNSLETITVASGNSKYHSNGNCIIETATNTIVMGCKTSIIPDYVTTIGDFAFCNYADLTSIEIPDNVVSIGWYAFSGCTSLTSIRIPDSVTNIEDCVFYQCSSLSSIEIPQSVTSIGSHAFYGCNSISDVYYDGTEIQWNDITIGYGNDSLKNAIIHFADEEVSDDIVASGECGENVTWTLDEDGLLTISGTGNMYNYEWRGAPWDNYLTSIKSVVIQNGVTSIGYYAFGFCKSLTSILISKSVTSIEEYVFWCCDSLETITVSAENEKYHSDGNCIIDTDTNTLVIGCKNSMIPDYVTAIGDGAFKGCRTLTSIEIPDSVINIGYEAFYYCRSLETIDISNSVKSIGDAAFCQCESLISIEIPDGLEEIYGWAFGNCTSLKTVKIPKSVTLIDSYAFTYCDSLETIIISEENSKYHVKNNCVIETDTNTLVFACKNAIVPDYIAYIEDAAFGRSTTITAIEIPKNVTELRGNPLSGCNSLETITVETGNTIYHSDGNCIIETDTNTVISGCKNSIIPNYVTQIGWSAFWECSSLTSITIPSNVKSIEDFAFYDCKNLTDVYYTGTEEEWKEITISSGNEYLTNATIHFNSSIPESGVAVSGNVKSFGNGNATVEFLCDGEVVDSMTASGTYSFENVEAGSYTIKVSKTKHATREYEITVGSENVTQNVEIWLYGDVTKDGIINNNDVIQINRKNANLSSVFSQTTDSDYRIKVANVTAPVNADAIINNTDVIQINRMNANLGSVFDRIA